MPENPGQPGSRTVVWWINDLGRIVEEAAASDAVASGWVDCPAGVGGITRVHGMDADLTGLPVEVLDLLEKKYPGTRWMVATGKRAA